MVQPNAIISKICLREMSPQFFISSFHRKKYRSVVHAITNVMHGKETAVSGRITVGYVRPRGLSPLSSRELPRCVHSLGFAPAPGVDFLTTQAACSR